MKNIYLLIISFSMISCYTYKAKTENDLKKPETSQPQVQSDEFSRKAMAVSQAKGAVAKSKTAGKPKADDNKNQNQPMNIQDKLEANKYFKIEVGGKPYKIQVDQWESDTLVAHVVHKPKKILKFHKNQINQSTIAERRFSQPVADVITVVAYAAVGVGIWALVK